MPRRGWKLRVRDMLESAELIGTYVDGMTFDEWTGRQTLMDSVFHRFMVIGEAARQVPAAVTERYPAIPWSEMRGMRNVVVHEYDRADLRTIWRTANDDIPPLIPLLRDLLESEPDDA